MGPKVRKTVGCALVSAAVSGVLGMNAYAGADQFPAEGFAERITSSHRDSFEARSQAYDDDMFTLMHAGSAFDNLSQRDFAHAWWDRRGHGPEASFQHLAGRHSHAPELGGGFTGGYGGFGGGVWNGFPHTTPVPEPESYAMMLLGLCLAGFAALRRKPS
jgi:hypothetical protein